jgi:hypothetical protein
VAELVGFEVAERKPFGMEGEHPPFGQVDGPDLFGVTGFSRRVVTVHIQDRRNFPLNLFGLIKQRRDMEPREAFVREFLDPISLPGFDNVAPNDAMVPFPPTFRDSLEDHLLEDSVPQGFRLRGPGFGTGGEVKRGNSIDEKIRNLVEM